MAEHENKDHVSDTLEAGMDTAGDIANNAYNHYKDRQNAASGNTPQRNNSSGDSTKSKDSNSPSKVPDSPQPTNNTFSSSPNINAGTAGAASGTGTSVGTSGASSVAGTAAGASTGTAAGAATGAAAAGAGAGAADHGTAHVRHPADHRHRGHHPHADRLRRCIDMVRGRSGGSAAETGPDAGGIHWLSAGPPEHMVR